MLSGRLIIDTAQNQIISLDVQTMEQTVLFDQPLLSWVYEIDASAAANQIAIAYTPPPEANMPPKYDRSGIYLLSLASSLQANPTHLIGGERANEWFVNPIWSADGEQLYFVRQAIEEQPDGMFETNVYLERMSILTGERDVIAEDAVWPRLSNDGKRLTWIIYDADLDQFGLMVANKDGSEQQKLIDVGALDSISTPIFSPDDQLIYFTAAAEQSTSATDNKEGRSFIDMALGVHHAEAHAKHNVLAHWWRIAADGGTPEQMTNAAHHIAYGDFSPVSPHLAYTTASGGLYLTDQDGKDEQALSETVIYRTFAWLP